MEGTTEAAVANSNPPHREEEQPYLSFISESTVSFKAVLEMELEAWETEKEAVLGKLAERLQLDRGVITAEAQAYNSIKVYFELRLPTTSDSVMDAAHVMPLLKELQHEMET